VQTSLGFYGFTSEAFPTFNGLIYEPIRFDLHWPARSAARTKNPVVRAFQALSLRGGVVMFPQGIEASRFLASGSAEGKDVKWSELIPDWGIVLNINRLIWKD